jgi:hypothetical protein
MQKMKEDMDEYLRKLSEETDRKIQEVAQQMRKENEETNRKMKATDIRVGARAIGSGNWPSIWLGRASWRNLARSVSTSPISRLDSGRSSRARTSKPLQSLTFSWKTEILRRHKDTIGDKRKIYGALAGAIMDDSIKNAILKAGLYAITQTGDTVKIDIPKGFKEQTPVGCAASLLERGSREAGGVCPLSFNVYAHLD